jgi:hypothetical protein
MIHKLILGVILSLFSYQKETELFGLADNIYGCNFILFVAVVFIVSFIPLKICEKYIPDDVLPLGVIAVMLSVINVLLYLLSLVTIFYPYKG